MSTAPIGGTTTEEPPNMDRAEWERRLNAAIEERAAIKAVYAAHMSNGAHHLYLAGESVKNGEFGFARAQHRLAQMSIDAALKALPE